MAKELITKASLNRTEADTNGDERPKNLRADVMPTEGYSIEVDGKLKAQHPTPDAAFKAALALKTKFPLIQVKVFDAKERTRTLVESPKA